MSHVRALLLIGAMAAMATSASAKVYSPWVLSEHTADMRDEVRFAADPRWADLEGQERALAVWRYLTDRETGTWHFSDMYEGADPHWESKLVKDPIKLLNVYGSGVCTMHASMIEGIYEALGYGVRQMEFDGYHRTAEVEWDGAWHYLDIDERAYLIDPSGRVVSVTEATTRPELWEPSSKSVSPFYPQNGGLRGIQELAKHGPPIAHWHWRTLGHSMDFTLRPGESLTRYWRPQGRWRVCEAWLAKGTRSIIEQDPAGPKTPIEISANNSYGNGKWVYEPTLSSASADFQEGVYRQRAVALEGRGLAPAPDADGYVEWRFRSPYTITGEPGDLDDPGDDAGAAIVEFTGEGPLALSVSTDHGRHWEEVRRSQEAGAQSVDLTRWVQGGYEYHLRFDLPSAASRLISLRVTSWVQLAPMGLPRLKAGANQLRFVWGDRHGLPAEAVTIEPEFSDAGDMARWGVEVSGDYDPNDRTRRARGPVTLRVDALAGSKLRWLQIGGAFNAQREAAPGGPDRILYSLDPASGWTLLREETPPGSNQHWYYNVESGVALDAPAESVWVRLDPATAANALRVHAHCQPDGAAQRGPVVVTHRFRIDGRLVEKAFTFAEPQAYQIDCEGEPENVSITLSVPSQPIR